MSWSRAGARRRPYPGGNITGFINIEASLSGRWIQMLKDIVPRVSRAALMFNPETVPHFAFYLQPFEAAAPPRSVMNSRVSCNQFLKGSSWERNAPSQWDNRQSITPGHAGLWPISTFAERSKSGTNSQVLRCTRRVRDGSNPDIPGLIELPT